MGQKFRDEAGHVWELGADGQYVPVQAAGAGVQIKAADPKLPGQIQGQGLSNAKTGLDVREQQAQAPFFDENARNEARLKGVQVQNQTQQLTLDKQKVGIGLANQYSSDPRVAEYRTALPQIVSAMTAGKGKQGDLTVVYSWAKAMDPSGSVREGDTDMANSTSSYIQQAKQLVANINQGHGLPPEVRRGLIEEARNKGHQLDLAYTEARKNYQGLAASAGLDPMQIIGPHDGEKYQSAEAAYKGAPVTNFDGSHSAAPVQQISDEQLREFVKQNANMAPEAMREYATLKFGRDLPNIDQVLAHYNQTGGLGPVQNADQTASAIGRGLAKGATHVWDRAAMGVESALNMIPGVNLNAAHQASATRSGMFAGQPVNQTAQTVGNVGAATLATLPVAGPVAAGAIGNMLMGDSNDAGGLAADAALGAVGGKVADLGLRGIAGVLSPSLPKPISNLAQEGVRLTPGRVVPGLKRFEDMGASLPIAGPRIDAALQRTKETLNRVPANRALAPIGQTLPDSVPAGHDAVKYTQQALSGHYNNAVAGKTINLDPTLVSRLNYFGQRGGLRPQELGELSDILQNEVGGAFSNGQGSMSGRDFKRLDEKLGQMASKFKQSDDPYRNQLGDGVGFIGEQLKALGRRQSPQMAADLRAADQGWANFVPYRAAAAANPTDGLATPGQFRTAVRQADRTPGKYATSQGDAMMQDFASDASKVIPADRGNSGTADRLNQTDWRAYLAGAAVSPLYTDPAIDILNHVATRKPGKASKAVASGLRKLPRGMFGGSIPYLIDPGQ